MFILLFFAHAYFNETSCDHLGLVCSNLYEVVFKLARHYFIDPY